MAEDTTPLLARTRGQKSRSRLLSQTGRTRRFTPYTKTPKSRKVIDKHHPLVDVTNRQRPAIPLTRFIKKTWYVYQVTPLFRFKQDEASLKRYSKHLSSFLQSQAQKGHGFGTDEQFGGRVHFQKVPGLVNGEGISDAIEITVSLHQPGGTEKVTLTMVLSSFGVKDLMEFDDLSTDFQRFPILLVKGLVTPMRNTISWLESQFDCRIRKMTFNPVHLSWMVAMWTGVENGAAVKPVELRYGAPPEVKGLSFITMTIQQEDAAKLWNSIHSDSRDDVNGDEVEEFTQALESHFYHSFKIHLSAMKLKRIGTPLACVGSEGRIKFLSSSSVKTVLYHLSELSLENTGFLK